MQLPLEEALFNGWLYCHGILSIYRVSRTGGTLQKDMVKLG